MKHCSCRVGVGDVRNRDDKSSNTKLLDSKTALLQRPTSSEERLTTEGTRSYPVKVCNNANKDKYCNFSYNDNALFQLQTTIDSYWKHLT